MGRRALAVALMLAAVAAGCGDDGGGGGGASTTTAGPSPGATVVRVVAGEGAARDVATGVVAGDGRVLTVAHALAPGAAVTVAAPGGPARRAQVLRADRRLDVAVLAVDGLRADVPATATAAAGQSARLVVLRGGARRSLAVTVRRPITARVRDQPDHAPLVRPGLELAAAVQPGDSGAPILDDHGRLLGVAFAASRVRPRTAYAVTGAAAVSVLRAARGAG
jgi:S1-C subfamily serine protease